MFDIIATYHYSNARWGTICMTPEVLITFNALWEADHLQEETHNIFKKISLL